MKLKQKVTFALIACSVLPVAFVSGVGLWMFSNIQEESAKSHLQAIFSGAQSEVAAFEEDMRKSVNYIAESKEIVEATYGLTKGFEKFADELSLSAAKYTEIEAEVHKYYTDAFGGEFKNVNGDKPQTIFNEMYSKNNANTKLFHYYYDIKNPNPVGKKDLMDKAVDGTSYSKVHAKFHPYFRKFVNDNQYYDFFLVDKNGNVVYSDFKEMDFATNLNSGPWANSKLADAYKTISKLPKGKFYMSDMEKYVPSYNYAATFYGTPVFDGNERIATIMVQVPIEKFTTILTHNKNWEKTGLGKTGEINLFGADGYYRSATRLVLENPEELKKNLQNSKISKEDFAQIVNHKSTAMALKSTNAQLKEAIAGKTLFLNFKDSKGNEVYSWNAPIDIGGQRWVIASKMNKDEIFAEFNKMKWEAYIFIIVLAIGMGYFAYMLANKFVAPILDAHKAMGELVKGNLEAKVNYKSDDELGLMAESINKTMVSIQAAFNAKFVEWNKVSEMKKREIQAMEEAKLEKDNAIKSMKEAEVASVEAMKAKKSAEESLITAEESKKKAEAAGLEAVEALKIAEVSKKEAEAASLASTELAEKIKRDNEELNAKVAVVLECVNKVAAGDLTVKMHVAGEDAVGKISKGLNTLFAQFRTEIEKIERISKTLDQTSVTILSINKVLENAQHENLAEATSASAATEQVAAGINSVTASTEEMLASVGEINKVTTESSKVVTNTEEVVIKSGELVNNLSVSTQGIDSVLKIINTIAAQTNLLALNATIEAARAGEAGKGFAVVAHEIKELANETHKATQEIENSISTIQKDSGYVIESIQDIKKAFEQISFLTSSVSTAVEEQMATSQSISQSMHEANTGVTAISKNVGSVKVNVENVSIEIGKSTKLAMQLSGFSSELKTLVGQFKIIDSENNYSHIKKVA